MTISTTQAARIYRTALDGLRTYFEAIGKDAEDIQLTWNHVWFGSFIDGPLNQDGLGFIADAGTGEDNELPEDKLPDTWRVRIVQQGGKNEFVVAQQFGEVLIPTLKAAWVQYRDGGFRPERLR